MKIMRKGTNKLKQIRGNSKEKSKKIKERGITLIALIVTIIVLLILAGITIATLTGKNGILTKATEAKEKTSYEGAKEKLSLILIELQTEKMPKGESLILGETLAEEIATYDEVTSASFTDNIIEVVIDGYTFEVNDDFGIEEQIEKVEPENLSDWEYTIEEDGTATLTCYKGTDTTVVIPNYINGYWVKKIGTNEKEHIDENDAHVTGNYTSLWGENIGEFIDGYDSWTCFVQNTIKEIIISEGIETIDNYAFRYSLQLENVVIPRSVTSIGIDAFALGRSEQNNNLREVNIYNNVQEMREWVFGNRVGLVINLEYKQDEIPDTWSVVALSGDYKENPVVNYGVTMN